jgi:endoglycosylceramidase
MMAYLMNHLEKRKNVVGIDIMNEPWPSPFLGFEKNVLTPFYEDIQKMRRLNGYTTPLFFEPVIYTSTGVPSGLRFKPDPDSVYAPHYYDPLCHHGYPYTRFGKMLMRIGVNIRLKEAKKFGVPALYGEFGISPTVDGFDRWLNDFLGLLREHHVGWTYYSLDKVGHAGFAVLDEQGTPRWILLEHLVWAYPQRVAGTKLETEYGDKHLKLSYDPIDTKAPTVLYIPARYANIRIFVNGEAVPFKPGQLYFEHHAKPVDGRQRIEARWD